jgi:hypothetical protein
MSALVDLKLVFFLNIWHLKGNNGHILERQKKI